MAFTVSTVINTQEKLLKISRDTEKEPIQAFQETSTKDIGMLIRDMDKDLNYGNKFMCDLFEQEK